MNMLAIDTLQYTKRLRNTGMAQDQAEAMAEALGEALTVNLATKDDLNLLDTKIESVAAELNAKIESVAAELNGRIDSLEARIDSLEARIDSLDYKNAARVDSLRAEIKEDVSKILRWMITSQIALAGLVIALLKFL